MHNTLSVPRPGYRAARLAYSLGLPLPVGYTCLSCCPRYRQNRRRAKGGAQ